MWDNRKIKVNIRTRRYAYDFPGNINGDGTDINLFPNTYAIHSKWQIIDVA